MSRRTPTIAIFAAAVIGGGTVAGLTGCGGAYERPATSSVAEAQTISFQQPEDPGPEPFTAPADVSGKASVALPASGSGDGKQPFGGSGSNRVCNRDKLIRFLRENPERRREWARVLGIDPSQRSVERYIASLHPVTLTRDTHVTNHAFRNGRAEPFQALLQSGTAVLVDRHGTPVVRCYCGNPLGPAVVARTAKCRGCPPNYRPPRQCTFGRREDLNKKTYRRRDYSNRDYDQLFIRGQRTSPFKDCYTAYPKPPVVTLVNVYDPPAEGEPDSPEPEREPESPSSPSSPPRSGICNDGLDNEGVPGRVDGDDPNCGGRPDPEPPEQPPGPQPDPPPPPPDPPPPPPPPPPDPPPPPPDPPPPPPDPPPEPEKPGHG